MHPRVSSHTDIYTRTHAHPYTHTRLDDVAESLEQLWISYNLIEKMAGVEAMLNLKVLYMSNNLVTKWSEVQRLAALPFLEEILMQVCVYICIHIYIHIYIYMS